jgi:redox-sensitive bicupin YhaK (pirin superfamily)
MPEITSLDELDATPHAEVFDQQLPRTVYLRLDSGDRIPPHRHPGNTVVLHVLHGTLELSLDGDPVTLETNDLIRFDGDRDISPHARTECEAVLVFSPSTN